MNAAATETVVSPSLGYSTKPYRAYVLGSLLLVYIFNFIDRTIINILTEPIKESFQVEDWQMGLLGGIAFAALYTMLGIPLARISERVNRVFVITCSVAVWSLFTILCGFASSFIMLFIMRICVGIGEAGCTPPAQSLIADYFAPKSRATAVSIYAMGVPLGGMIAGLSGGIITEQLTGENVEIFLTSIGLIGLFGGIDWSTVEGWRIAFVVVGLPGMLVALVFNRTVKEPPRGFTDPESAQKQERVTFGEALKVLAGKPTYWHVVIGATIASFIGYGVGQFTTSFLIRTHGLSLTEAALLFSLILGLMAAIGVWSSGFLADRFAKRHPTALSWIPALGMLFSVPLYVFGYSSSNLWIAMPPLMIAAMIHYYYLGPMYAVSGGVADSRMRATSVAITLLVVNIIGLGLGPPAMGFLSTFLKSMYLSGSDLNLTLEACKAADLGEAASAACSSANARGLQTAIIAFCCLYAWAALHYLLAGRTMKRDMVAMAG
ncbi:MAG: MFS transporter [Henriciella sp.]|jgi:predicted MFS family arabinose efflux permease